MVPRFHSDSGQDLVFYFRCSGKFGVRTYLLEEFRVQRHERPSENLEAVVRIKSRNDDVEEQIANKIGHEFIGIGSRSEKLKPSGDYVSCDSGAFIQRSEHGSVRYCLWRTALVGLVVRY